MSNYIIALDQSTRYTRCVIFNRLGHIVSQCVLKHRQVYPEVGWVEHYPLEIWANTQVAITSAMDKLGITAGDVAAIGIANQRETTVVWNRRTGKPYYNAIVWRDSRTVDICYQLAKDGGQDRFRSKVGLPITTYFSAPKLKWLLDHIAGLRTDAERGEAIFGTMDSWLIWNLTGGVNGGVHVTDVTNASRTMLMNLATTNWDNSMCEAMSIPRAMLPQIRPSSDPDIYGHTQPDGPVGGSVPICGILGSQQAAAVGHVCLHPGEVKNSYDGASFVIMNTGHKIIHSRHGLLTTVCYKFGHRPPVYALEGAIAFTGMVVEWLQENLGLIEDFAEVEALAKSVEDNGDVYFVPAFKGLFAPYWRSDARGAIVGLTHSTNRGHLARAALEAIAYQTHSILDAMEADLGAEALALKVDGEMTTNNLLMQFQADLLGIPVVRPKENETTALGAAYVAGLAIGFWRDLAEIQQQWSVDKVWKPGMSRETRARLYKNWQKAVARTFCWNEPARFGQIRMQANYFNETLPIS
ncbi:MAG: glycerol kinase GlpK [Anaerolineaceae bacterium]|nr:glycerol kinase GlpK [Anaerolineaceae bacterium]MCB9100622.1 glycerol kinase GlpK [Anaerolineales bacterium]